MEGALMGRIISGGLLGDKSLQKKAGVPSPQPQENNNAEGWAGTILRNAYRTIPSAISGALGGLGSLAEATVGQFGRELEENIPDFPKQLLPRNPLPTVPQVHETIQGIEDKFLPKGYSTPKGGIEEYLNMIQQDVPRILSSGGAGILPALGRSAGSNLGAKVAQEAGLGELGQLAGGALGGVGADILRRGGRPGYLRKTFESTDKAPLGTAQGEAAKFYKAAKKRATKLTTSASELDKHIAGEIDKLSFGKSGLTDRATKQIRHELSKLGNSIKKDTMNVHDAIEYKQHFNSLYKNEVRKNPTAANYYKRAVGSLNENIIQKAAKEHKLFGKQWNLAEDFHKARVASGPITKMFEKNPTLVNAVKNPYLISAALGTLGWFGGPAKAALVGGGALLGKTAVKNVEFFMGHPSTQRLISKISKAALKDNKQQFQQLLTKLDHHAQEMMPSEEKKEKIGSGKGRIVSGGLKI